MSTFTSRPAMRWLVPITAAAVLVGGAVAIGALAASAEPALPPRSAEQLLVDLATAEVDGVSGTVVHRAALGLPPALGLAAQYGSGLNSLVDGTHTLRVWYAGPDQARVAVIDTLGETDLIRNGRDLWIWSSRAEQAIHHVLPDDHHAGRATTDGATPGALPATGLPASPLEAADHVLAAIDPSTAVSVGRSAEIAGRPAYELILTPRDPATLIGQIRIAIDATEHLPLRFALYARGAERAAIETAFTQVDFNRPDAEQFTFNPPPGSTVTDGGGLPFSRWLDPAGEGPSDGPAEKPGTTWPDLGTDPTDAVTAVGTGWAGVLVVDTAGVPTGAPSAEEAGAEALTGALPQVSGSWGTGRLLSSELFTVLIVDDGRIIAGAVGPERLYEVAAQGR